MNPSLNPKTESLRRTIAAVGWIAALAGTLALFFLAVGLAFPDAKLAPAQACAVFVAVLALVCHRALGMLGARLEALEASVRAASRKGTPAA